MNRSKLSGICFQFFSLQPRRPSRAFRFLREIHTVFGCLTLLPDGQYLVIYDELITNFFLALAAVGVLLLIVMGRISIVIIVCLSVVRKQAALPRSCQIIHSCTWFAAIWCLPPPYDLCRQREYHPENEHQRLEASTFFGSIDGHV